MLFSGMIPRISIGGGVPVDNETRNAQTERLSTGSGSMSAQSFPPTGCVGLSASLPIDLQPDQVPLQPRVFSGVFGKSSSKAVPLQRSAVDMAELAHPVYAPGGSVLSSELPLTPPQEPVLPQLPKPPRKSPFDKS